jgi:hypothetical protein
MYYIYHIEGVKIGCSTQVEKRIKQQGYNNFEILEEHIDIYEVSDRELELQKQYGYKVDTIPYWKSHQQLRKNATFKSAQKGGLKGGQTSKELGHIQRAQKVGCVLGGRAGKGRVNPYSQSLADNGHMKVMAQKAKQKLSKPIIAFKNNIEIEFNSISDAGRELGIKLPNIVSVLKNTKSKTAKGYTFKYKQL